ncbi:MAG: hypothetical protein ABIT10_13860 [Alteraurantiacibacter sp.]
MFARLPLLAAALPPVLALALGGCVSTVASVVTAPVRAVSGAVDLATTSQSEADEKRGREMRQREEQVGRLDRRYRNLSEDCGEGDRDACMRARDVRRERDELLASPLDSERDD